MMQIDDNRIYLRQESLGINTDQHVAVIGVGGIGSWIAMFLGLAGVKKIDLYDSDTLEAHNLNRFPLGPEHLGKHKSMAMADHILGLRKDVEVTPRMDFDPEIHRDKLTGYSWVIVSTDSLKSRRMIWDTVEEFRKQNGFSPRYIECGAEGHQGSVSFKPAEFATEDEENPGYRSVPVFVGPCVMAAATAVYHILLEQTELSSDWIYQMSWGRELRPGLLLNRFDDRDGQGEMLTADQLAEELRPISPVEEVEEITPEELEEMDQQDQVIAEDEPQFIEREED